MLSYFLFPSGSSFSLSSWITSSFHSTQLCRITSSLIHLTTKYPIMLYQWIFNQPLSEHQTYFQSCYIWYNHSRFKKKKQSNVLFTLFLEEKIWLKDPVSRLDYTVLGLNSIWFMVKGHEAKGPQIQSPTWEPHRDDTRHLESSEKIS